MADIAQPRPATPAEIELWRQFKQVYYRRVTPAVERAKVAAEIAADAQVLIERLGKSGWIFDAQSLRDITQLLDRFNKLGRIITAVESGRYFVQTKSGDIHILASQQMPEEQYKGDVIDGSFGAVPVIIWAIAVGVVIVAGIFAVSAIIESNAERQTAANEAALIEADKEMAKSDPATRRAWSEFKRQNQTKAQTVGVLEKVFGSSAVSSIASALGIGLVAYLAISAFSRGR